MVRVKLEASYQRERAGRKLSHLSASSAAAVHQFSSETATDFAARSPGRVHLAPTATLMAATARRLGQTSLTGPPWQWHTVAVVRLQACCHLIHPHLLLSKIRQPHAGYVNGSSAGCQCSTPPVQDCPVLEPAVSFLPRVERSGRGRPHSSNRCEAGCCSIG